MSPKRWFALLAFYISYLFFGASIYYWIEHAEETKKREEALNKRIEIYEYLIHHFKGKDNNTQVEIMEKITNYCGKPVTDYNQDKFEDPFRWTFYHSLFFAYTVCSTVGYGNLAPSTTFGQMILIVYSLIGVPVNGILFAGLGDYFSRFFINIYKRYKDYKMSNDDLYVPRQFGLFATILIALVPGITFFIIIPSCMFTYFEDWPFTLSLYYSYVTTTTIGFGDYVPTFQPDQERKFGISFVFYQIFIFIWFIFALGYLLMIMTFITKGLRCNKLAQLEKQLSYNIKATQSRIWHGVTKDVGYLRRILNELVINVKPVYNEPGEKNDVEQLPRSASCPDLEMYRVTSPIVSRKRAFSESFDKLMDDNRLQLAAGSPLVRVASDTNLNKINKNKTFGTVTAFKETTSLLARVVTALAKIEAPPPEEDTNSINSFLFGGYNGFTDSQILASELSFPYAENRTIPYRTRACSECFLNRTAKPTALPTYNEWTWGGDNDKIQQLINNRARISKKQQEILKKSAAFNGIQKPNDNSVIVNVNADETVGKPKTRKFSTDSKAFLKRFIPFKKRTSQDTLRKQSTISVPEEPQTFPQIESLYSTISGSQPTVVKMDRRSSIFPPINNYFSNLFTNNTNTTVDRKDSETNIIPDLEPRRKRFQSYNETKSISNIKANNTAGVDHNNTRRGSLFNNSGSERRNNFIKNSDIRASIKTPSGDRYGSNFIRGSEHRGSIIVPSLDRHHSSITSNQRSSNSFRSSIDRQGSLFSVPSEEELEMDKTVLENTSIADLIRALERLHTHTALQPTEEEVEVPKKRKVATVIPPKFPQIFTLFNENENKPPANSGRRSTIFGTLTSQPTQQNLSRRSLQRSSTRPKIQPPSPLLSQPEDRTPKEPTSKFRRRFSVRPTELQIPLGKAPPVPSSITQFSSQTALQRRLSLRPSPLARELAKQASSGPGSTSTGNSGVGRGSTSSTHSPLSRMAQIQSSRKNSKPDLSPLGLESINKEQPK